MRFQRLRSVILGILLACQIHMALLHIATEVNEWISDAVNAIRRMQSINGSCVHPDSFASSRAAFVIETKQVNSYGLPLRELR